MMSAAQAGELSSELLAKLTAARTLGSARAYQEWLSRRIDMFADETRMLLADTQKLVDVGARLFAIEPLGSGTARHRPRSRVPRRIESRLKQMAPERGHRNPASRTRLRHASRITHHRSITNAMPPEGDASAFGHDALRQDRSQGPEQEWHHAGRQDRVERHAQSRKGAGDLPSLNARAVAMPWLATPGQTRAPRGANSGEIST